MNKPLSFLKTALAGAVGTVIGSIFIGIVFGIFLIILIASVTAEEEVVVKDKTILVLDISGSIGEKGNSPFEIPTGIPMMPAAGKTGLWELRQAIKKAKTDDRIVGIYLKPKAFSAGWATVEALRDEIVDFKESEKFVIAYSEIYTEKSWYLATAADEIYMYPEGGMEFNGLAATPMFMKGAFDKLGIEPMVFRVGSYKAAVEPYTRENMSDANREQMKELLDGMWGQFINTASEARGLSVAQLTEYADSLSVQYPEDAVNLKLIDGLKTEAEILRMFMSKTEAEKMSDLNTIKIKKYVDAKVASESKDRENKLAVIFAEGAIVDGKGEDDEIGSATLVSQIRKVKEDEKVKAVVLRVNSPGGSALASDVILAELMELKAEKPLIVSMGDLAASGGYYIACKADKIYAEPSTITGSIGVFGLWFNTGDLFKDKLGITFDRVHTNPYADIGNTNRQITEFEAQKIQNGVDRIYARFITLVDEGREQLPDTSAVHKIAQGRVWTGKKALEIGLVDELGGLDEAMAEAASRAGLPEDYKTVTYPKKKDPFREIMEKFGQTSVKEFEQFQQEMEMYRKVKQLIVRNGVYTAMPMELNIE